MGQVKQIFLDHAAGTFLLPEVKTSLESWLESQVINPSSIHAAGRESAAVLDASRRSIARSLVCKPAEIIFTSGGTEANNLAIMGCAKAMGEKGRHIITCATEHPSVVESCRQLESAGFEVTYLAVDTNGDINQDLLKSQIRNDTILLSLMWTNNETGLNHPIKQITKISRDAGIHFHCDAVQAIGHKTINLDTLGVDSLSFSGHKLGTPAGIGALYLRKGATVQSGSYGGSQEQNLRAGTPNHLGARALARAVEVHVDRIEQTEQHYSKLLKKLQAQLQTIPGIQINRGGNSYTGHILNCSFKNIDGETLFIRLDMKNIAVSNGAACSSGSQAPSHVLTALGLEKNLAQASLRISMGVETTEQEIDVFCQELEHIIRSIQKET